MWHELVALCLKFRTLGCIGGDLNVVANENERRGGANAGASMDLANLINEAELMDVRLGDRAFS